jgi:hypothetical protein
MLTDRTTVVTRGAFESTMTLGRLLAIGGSIGEFIERQQGRTKGSAMKNSFRLSKSVTFSTG